MASRKLCKLMRKAPPIFRNDSFPLLVPNFNFDSSLGGLSNFLNLHTFIFIGYLFNNFRVLIYGIYQQKIPLVIMLVSVNRQKKRKKH